MGLTDVCRRAFYGLLGTAMVTLALIVALRANDLIALVRRVLGGAAAVALALTLASSVRANELSGASRSFAPGIVIHGAAETLRDYCRPGTDGRMWFTLPGGASFELVTSTSDPAVTNPGDGAFHPYDADEVRATLAAVRYPIETLSAQVYILPYPRRGGLESAAGPGLVLLSPGVRPLTREHQHAEFVHELGHLVQYARMPDSDLARWRAYRELRGIADESVYCASAPHADRPHEIFAEDFRALFGDPLANYSGSVENSELPPPSMVSGLAGFIERLAQLSLPLSLAPASNPARGAAQFVRSGASTAPLDLFDVGGRHIATLEPAAVAGGTLWRWNGNAAAGRAFAGGVVFARLRGEPGGTRVTLLR
jgi:hypothetical protein